MEVRFLLEQATDDVRQALEAYGTYSFSEELKTHMKRQGLSSVALGNRCGVSHTMVDKWRQGKAKPNGKERMKELGIALGMDAEQLDTFLYRNGYPKLYAKNPLDSAAKLLLINCAGREDAVKLYQEFIDRLGLTEFAISYASGSLATSVMSGKLREAAQQGQMTGWFSEHEKDFTGNAKGQRMTAELVHFIMLYIGEQTIYGMSVAAELPVNLRNLLYPIKGRKAITTRYLRTKLIAFGLYSNMTVEELDAMLTLARLRPVSEPETKLDAAILCLMQDAHGRCPTYEYENLVRICKRLSASKDGCDHILLADYKLRLDCSEKLMAYYEKSELTDEDRCFEIHYTSFGGYGLMDYIRDVLEVLNEENLFDQAECKQLLELLSRKQEGE